MADTKLVDLTETSVVALDDVVYTVDVSDTTDAATGSSRKLSVSRALGVLNNVCQGRLTLSTGNAVYTLQAATPSSTDTSAETTTFATAHGWTTGTMVTPSATGGGLTAGTTYYINATSSTACSYHTTLANAEAASSAVNLTSSITAEIRPFGVQSTTIRFTPYTGNLISIYDGTRWKLYAFSELNLALGTLTSGKNYDVFLYDNAGTLTLEATAWNTDTARTTNLTLQDGVYVKSGATTRRYLGTFRTTSTTTTEDSGGGTTTQVGGKRFLWNLYNQVERFLAVKDTSDNWTYATNTWRQANAASGNKVEYVVGLQGNMVKATVHANGYGSGIAGGVGVGVDSTSSTSAVVFQQLTTDSNAPNAAYLGYPGVGYHYLAWVEIARVGTITFQGDDGVTSLQSGLIAEVWG